MGEPNYEVVEHDLGGASAPVPVTFLTGVLGAGKTTLLNCILNGDHGLRVAVLVNDFGSINIDADLVVDVESDVISLANGCICCTMRDDLAKAVTSVIERPERPEYILPEASGVADPSGIAITFLDPNLRERVRLDSITCVVDADQVFAAPEQMELKIRQIAFSDMVLLNKVDLVDEAQHAKIGPDLARMNEILAGLRRLRDSIIPELLILLAIVVRATTSYRFVAAQSIGDLAFQSPTGVHLTPAGWYSMLVSAPVVQFLGAVVLWRWLLRTIFAFRLSRLNLRLIPSHPDENGGLGSFPFLPRLSCRYLLQYPLSLELHSAMTSCSRCSFSASCMLVVNPQHAICSRLLLYWKPMFPSGSSCYWKRLALFRRVTLR